METWEKAQSIVGTSPGRPKDDFYPTPYFAIDALLSREEFPRKIWEPACGQGHISEALLDNEYEVHSSDLYDHGYGNPFVDFLTAVNPFPSGQDFAVITNPPFKYWTEFAKHALDVGARRVALLGKLSALEGVERSAFLMSSPLHYVYVFRRRLTMTRKGEAQRGGGMIAFAWYVWDVPYTGTPRIRWI